jgi:hypothetical protein
MTTEGTPAEDLPTPDAGEAAETPEQAEERVRHDHDEQLVEEWEDESFPASDPPAHY